MEIKYTKIEDAIKYLNRGSYLVPAKQYEEVKTELKTMKSQFDELLEELKG